MTVTLKEWTKYRDLLAKLSQTAADEFRDAVWGANGRWKGAGLSAIPREDLIDYAYALVTKYGEGSAELACEMYDAIAALSGVSVPPAVPAETAKINEVGKALNGAIKVSQNEEYVSEVVNRLVKQAGQDTTLQNAKRDGAEFAWIPAGETCAYCLGLAAIGWQKAGKTTLKGGHAEHIHGNCDCAYAIRFNDDTKYADFEPQKYADMFDMWSGNMPGKAEINALRREFYAENSEEINEQKRSAYAKMRARESSQAVETYVK